MRYAALFLTLFFLISCSNDNPSDSPSEDSFTIWQGEAITFSKDPDTDPNLVENQDAITASVAITRGNDGGQIYNILQEESADKDLSPSGTKWAIGETTNLANLNFRNFRDAVGQPKEVVGKNLVLYIEEEDIYIAVKFLSWGQGKNGAFSYQRSTE